MTAYEIVTWGDSTRDWNRRLGVTMLRRGCELEPVACLRNLEVISSREGVSRWTLAIKGSPERLRESASEYSRLSLIDGRLVEVGVDDFVSAMSSWNLETVGGGYNLLAAIAAALKSENPKLRFGITLYEDELDSRILSQIPDDTRAQVDRVSLYLHYRGNAGKYEGYVKRVRVLFPAASVWAGSYAYDRRDYLPCYQGDDRHCSGDQEMRLFRDSLKTQIKLLQEGEIVGIEFYPGFFGREAEWRGWGNPRICAPPRRLECIETTERMREVVGELVADDRRWLGSE